MIAGVERVVHFLVVSFPYSNMRWVVALPGETSECVCQGLLWIFERMGMAPRVVVFDNATGVGHRRPDGTVTQTRLFSLFCAHYGFEPRFCNPYSGHEKGSVENAVGFVRCNLMVPMPSAESFQTLTRVWLDECERVAGSDHYRHGVPVIELFEAEKDHMLPLPGVRFDPCDWRSVKADKTGAVTIDANRYLAGPKWRSMRLQAGVRVFEIELRGPDGETITTLERIWGHSAKTQVDPASLLAIIARKSRIWGESPIRNDFPETVRVLLDRMDARTRSNLLDDIRAVAADWGREQLESLEFVDRAEDLVLYGDVGCGKTHLDIAIGMLACQRMIPVRFFTASSLVMRLRKAKDDNRLDAKLKSIGRAGLVIIDELGYLPIDIDGARLLFQVIADSYETRSVIFTSNLESGRWGDVFGDGDMAAAVIDRIVHHGRILRFHGESYRNRHSLMK